MLRNATFDINVLVNAEQGTVLVWFCPWGGLSRHWLWWVNNNALSV